MPEVRELRSGSGSEVCQRLGGYATLLFVFGSLLFYVQLLPSLSLLLFLVKLCCVLFIHKKTFQLTNAKQISNKSAKFWAANKFLADFFCVFFVLFCFAYSLGKGGGVLPSRREP